MTVTFAPAPDTDRPNKPFGKPGVSYDIRDVFGDARSRDVWPQVFLVEQVGNTAPHYHQVPQFQVFVHGEGTFGRSPIGPRVIHYADAWTTYGPIRSDDPLRYFTARLSPDLGAFFMPESKDEKPFRSGRHHTVELEGAATLPAAGEAVVNQLFGPYEDGLGAQEALLGPDASLVVPKADLSRLVMVVSGALVHDGARFTDLSWVAMTGADDSVTLTAGPEGAHLAVLDYPKPDVPAEGAPSAGHTVSPR